MPPTDASGDTLGGNPHRRHGRYGRARDSGIRQAPITITFDRPVNRTASPTRLWAYGRWGGRSPRHVHILQ